MGSRGSKLLLQETELTALGFTRKPQSDVEETVSLQTLSGPWLWTTCMLSSPTLNPCFHFPTDTVFKCFGV